MIPSHTPDRHDRTGSGRRLVVTLGGLVLAGLLIGVAGWWLDHRSGSGPTAVVLQSGDIITVHSSSYGTYHPVPARYPLEHRLPQGLRSWIVRTTGIASSAAPVTSAEPTLVLWLKVSPPPGGRPAGVTRFAVHLAGDDPNASEAPLWGPARDVALFRGIDLIPVEFPAFPRRAESLRVRFFSPTFASARVEWGALEVKNPAIAKAPAWTATPLPARSTNGPLVCFLGGMLLGTDKSLEVAQPATGPSRALMARAGPTRPGRAALFAEFRETGSESGPWTLGRLEVADAAGNVVPGTSLSLTHPGPPFPGVVAAWSPVPWPDEVWELRLEARRSPQAAFSREERLTWEGVELPARGATNHPGLSGTASGAELQLTSVDREAPAEQGPWGGPGQTQFHVNVRGLAQDMYLDLLGVTDERGRKFTPEVRGESHGMPGAPRALSFGFQKLPDDAGRVRVDWAVQRGVPFRFRIDPRVPAPHPRLDWQPPSASPSRDPSRSLSPP